MPDLPISGLPQVNAAEINAGPTIVPLVVNGVTSFATLQDFKNAVLQNVLIKGVNMNYGMLDSPFDGAETQFTFPHGLPVTPTWMDIEFSETIDQNILIYSLSFDATNFIITFQTAPTSFTTSIYWEVRI